MATCLVCGNETGSETICQRCGTEAACPTFLSREGYDEWRRVYLIPRQKAWIQKQQAEQREQERRRARAASIRAQAGRFFAAGLDFYARLEENGKVTVSDGAPLSMKLQVRSWQGIVCLAAGDSHLLGLTGDGNVVAAGMNTVHQCDVEQWRSIVEIAANGRNSVGVDAGGKVYACGENQYDILSLTERYPLGAQPEGGWARVALGTNGIAWISGAAVQPRFHWIDFGALESEGVQSLMNCDMQHKDRLVTGQTPSFFLRDGDVFPETELTPQLTAPGETKLSAMYASWSLCAAIDSENRFYWARRIGRTDKTCWRKLISEEEQKQGICSGTVNLGEYTGEDSSVLNFVVCDNGEKLLFAVNRGENIECWSYSSHSETPERI